MTYSIYNTSSTQTYTVTDGTVNVDLDIGLVGKGYLGYGPTVNRNFLQLLENFSNASAPTKPVKGQIWYDSLNNVLKVYNGTSFVGVIGSTLSAADLNLTGNLTVSGTTTFYGTVNLPTIPSLGVTGALSGSSVAATGAVTGGTVTSTGVMTSNGNLVAASGTASSSTTTGALVVSGGAGVSGDLRVGGTIYGTVSGGISVSSINNTPIGNLTPATGAFTTLAATGTFTVNSLNNPTAVANGGTNGVGNIGSSGSTFNTVFAKATTAQYADLAEYYSADAIYEPGTVVEFGGSEEITIGTTHTSRVAGVVSTEPGFVMNQGATGTNMTPVALVGRVPCHVIGIVHKGDLMVSAGNGVAVANNSPTPGTIIGKSLEDKITNDKGTIEIVVGRF